jgi:hypothetical protein
MTPKSDIIKDMNKSNVFFKMKAYLVGYIKSITSCTLINCSSSCWHIYAHSVNNVDDVIKASILKDNGFAEKVRSEMMKLKGNFSVRNEVS